MFMRPARKSDAPAISELLSQWLDCNAVLKERLAALLIRNSCRDTCSCNILEAQGKILCASFWQINPFREVDLFATNFLQEDQAEELFEKFLEHEIVEWSRKKIERIHTDIPELVGETLPRLLKKSGFMFECFSNQAEFNKVIIRMTKTLSYEIAPRENLLDFLKEKFSALGYEIMPEANGFVFRIKELYQRPFLVGTWHRVALSGNDIIIYPPAKKLEPHEIETIFYPLRITGIDEAPILVTLEKKRACSLLDLPQEDFEQKNIFGNDSELMGCPFSLSNITYCIASGHKGVRKGLPILFYVNRVGAVGEARVVDWNVETVTNLVKNIENFPGIRLDDLDLLGPKPESKTALLLKIKFNYYRSFHRAVPFEEIKTLDGSFNPQRRRFVSHRLFESISELGYQTA